RQRPSASEFHRTRRRRARTHHGSRRTDDSSCALARRNRRGGARARQAQTPLARRAALADAAARDAGHQADARSSRDVRAGQRDRVNALFATVILDVDSTVAGIEGIDWLAQRRGPDVAAKIAQLTDDAMRGTLPLEAVYGARLDAIRPTRA